MITSTGTRGDRKLLCRESWDRDGERRLLELMRRGPPGGSAPARTPEGAGLGAPEVDDSGGVGDLQSPWQ
ncbi:unnamed protein product [Lampetra planeri]